MSSPALDKPSRGRRVARSSPGFRRRHALVVLNGGIGNLIIAAPVLRALESVWPSLRYHVVTVVGQEEWWLVHQAGLRAMQPDGPDPIWRRFRPEIVDALLEFCEARQIDLLINLRKESRHLDGDYFRFKQLAEKSGIECWDLYELSPRSRTLPIAQEAYELIQLHGIDLPPLRVDWLRHRRRTADDAGLGCFVGASQGVKRWLPAQWTAALQLIQRRHRMRISVAYGHSPAEQRVAEAIKAALPEVCLKPPGSVADLVDWIGSLEALVVNDTMVTHAAAAVGCPTVGLYSATNSGIWAPLVCEESRFVALQSEIALRCRGMKEDGTCTRYYLGCPAPCRKGIGVQQVADAVDRVLDRRLRTPA